MSRLQTAGGAARSNVQTVAMSFIGTIVAMAAAFAIFNFSQPARAESAATNADFEKYAQAYMAGFTANMSQTNGTNNNGGGCNDPQVLGAHTTSAPAGQGGGQMAAYHKAKPDVVKHITNSYNNYMSNKTTVNNSYEKNINSNNKINSDNKSTSVVVVKDSDGAVVSTNTSNSGDNKNEVDVENKGSNNDTQVNTVINDSFNKDSHDKTVIVNDSFNKEEKTTVIKDSFNSVEIKGGDKDCDHDKKDCKHEQHPQHNV